MNWTYRVDMLEQMQQKDILCVFVGWGYGPTAHQDYFTYFEHSQP